MSATTRLTDSAFPSLGLNIRDVLCALGKDTNLDRYSVQYCLRRFYKEGFPFLTRVLPTFSKAILHSLEKGKLEVPKGFRLNSRGFPRLLARQLLGLFTPDGYLLPEPDPRSLYEIRTFCECFYKTDIPFDEARLVDASISYLENEAENRSLVLDDRHCKNISNHVQWACEGFGPLIDELAGNCRFGPGANSDISFSSMSDFLNRGSTKFRRRLSASLRKILDGEFSCHPLLKRLKPLVSGFNHEYTKRWFGRIAVQGIPSRVSKVLFVPKDSRGPRTISSEPSDLSWVQMGFFDSFTRHLEQRTSGRIMFTDQSVNQGLALQGSLPRFEDPFSVSHRPCTGDLKDASDRITMQLVHVLFRRTRLFPFLLQARSDTTRISLSNTVSSFTSFYKCIRTAFGFLRGLPGSSRTRMAFSVSLMQFLLCRLLSVYNALMRFYRWSDVDKLLRRLKAIESSPGTFEFSLSKFGGMGSGLTFPILALTIWATCVDVIVRIYNVPRSQARKLVYVYGDDFIVPKEYFLSCCRALEKVGLKVNLSKSFYRSDFRESCGHDYLRGVKVTPQIIRLSGCEARYDDALRSIRFGRNVLALYKLNALAHGYDQHELIETCSYFYDLVRKNILLAHPSATFPYVALGSTVLGTASNSPLKMNDLFGLSSYDSSGMGLVRECITFHTESVRFPANVGHGAEWLFYHSLPKGEYPLPTDQVPSMGTNGEGFASSLDHLFPRLNSLTSYTYRGRFYFLVQDLSHMSVT